MYFVWFGVDFGHLFDVHTLHHIKESALKYTYASEIFC